MVFIGLRIPWQYKITPIGCGQMDINHLHGGQFFQYRSGCESWRQGSESVLECDLQAIGDERHEKMSFDARILLVVK